MIERDEHPRSDTTLERLGDLRALMARGDPEATVTAGNASSQNDAAAVCIVTHPDKAAELGLQPFARLVTWAVAGVAPASMGIGPVPSTRRALERAGLRMEDMDLIELNEAFAAQVLAVLHEWDLPDGLERVNVHGSGISPVIPSERRAGGSWPLCCGSCAVAVGATGLRACASGWSGNDRNLRECWALSRPRARVHLARR